VIDVQVRPLGEPRHHEVDERFELASLLVGIERPEPGEHTSGVHPSQQVVQSFVERVRIALDVEEEIPGRGLRKREQARARLGVQQELVFRQAFPAPLEMDTLLFPDLHVGRIAHALEPGCGWKGALRELFQPRHLVGLERRPLLSSDPRDQREVVVLPPAFFADRRPLADVTVRARLRVGFRFPADRLEEGTLHGSVVGREVRNAERFERGADALFGR
jgi:hypothetical protein